MSLGSKYERSPRRRLRIKCINAEVKNASRIFEEERREPAKALTDEINTKISFLISYDPGGSSVRKTT